MIARFRDRELGQRLVMTTTAGLLIGVCWVLRFWHPLAHVEAVLALVATACCRGPIIWRRTAS